jgi:cytochrome c oxidase assembly protein subunit 15
MRPYKRLSNAVAGLIAYSLLVFLWGAWVRISGSGDGCGEHWPFCYGVLIPESGELKLLIENFHRISTKLYGIFVMGLIAAIFWKTPKGHSARKFILWVFFFTLMEGLIGAVIVLKGLVTDDQSVFRALMISVHLANTFLLMSSIGFCWFSLHYDKAELRWRQGLTPTTQTLGAALIGIGALGAIAALSTTLFPSTTLMEGLAKDFSSASHFLLRLRVFHPLLGAALFMWVLWMDLATESRFSKTVSRLFKSLFAVNILVGFVTLGFLSPTVLKLTHLLLAHLHWMSLTFLIAERAATRPERPLAT